jgi:hypothetical protein
MHLLGVEIPDSLIPVTFVMFVGLLGWMVREQGKLTKLVAEIRAEFRERISTLEKEVDALKGVPRPRGRRERHDDA